MKKFIIFVGLLLTMPHTAVADQQDIPLEYNQKSNPNKNGNVNRAPMHLPIDVFYDSPDFITFLRHQIAQNENQ